MVWLSEDGKSWGEGHATGDPNLWLWGVGWHKGTVFSIGYADRKVSLARL